MIKALQIDNKNVYIVTLPRGSFEIETQAGKEAVSIDDYRGREINVAAPMNIREISESTITSHYESGEGDKLSVDEHSDQYSKLSEKRRKEVVDEDGDVVRHAEWKTLEDEFAFRKFNSKWNPITRVVTTISEPLTIEYGKVQFNTGNKFILPQYAVGGEPEVYEYNQLEASFAIVRGIMEELGVKREEDEPFSKATGKAYSIPAHSGLRYLQGWGEYLLSDRWNLSRNPVRRGSLKDLKEIYAAHSKELNEIIRSKYNLKFASIEDSAIVDMARAIAEDTSKLVSCIAKVSPKQKTYHEHAKAKELAAKVNAAVISITSK